MSSKETPNVNLTLKILAIACLSLLILSFVVWGVLKYQERAAFDKQQDEFDKYGDRMQDVTDNIVNEVGEDTGNIVSGDGIYIEDTDAPEDVTVTTLQPASSDAP